MSFTKDLLLGLKAELVAAGITELIVFGDLPSEPHRAIGLSAYATVDDATVAHSTLRVQLMARGVPNDSLDVHELADSAFLALQTLENRTYGTAHLVQCLRVSSVPLGIDDAKRSARSDNYEVDVDLPLTAGRPF
ncbi:hypothetical protein GCM10027053_51990 [Intrasporangium mesophilum]